MGRGVATAVTATTNVTPGVGVGVLDGTGVTVGVCDADDTLQADSTSARLAAAGRHSREMGNMTEVRPLLSASSLYCGWRGAWPFARGAPGKIAWKLLEAWK